MISLEGQRFGKWTVIGPPERIFTQTQPVTVSLCRCDCGAERKVKSNRLKGGRSKGCGCLQNGGGLHPARVPDKLSWGKYSDIKNNALNRMYRFHADVTQEFLQELYEKQNGRCALSGLAIEFANGREHGSASLDRKDNKKHYTRENVQWVHKDINRLKKAWSQERFIELCRAVADTMTW